MMNAKELIAAATQRTTRDAAMKGARSWATNDSEYTERKLCVKYAREAIKRARKANAKLVALKQAGSARPMTVVLTAVMPLIDVHSERAMAEAQTFIKTVRSAVALIGSPELAYPVVELTHDQRWNKRLVAERNAARAMQALAKQLVTDEGAERFTANEIEDARHQFIAYAFKLDGKVGNVKAATLRVECGVWGESYLEVTEQDGFTNVWKTQTIVNRSVLGKRFLQFPTRMVKS